MKHSKGGLHRKLLKITIIPLLLTAIIISFASYVTFNKTMQKEVQRGLKSVAVTTLNGYEMMYDGDYSLRQSGDTYLFYKGDEKLSGNYEYIDSIKKETNIDITFFFYDMRALTTLKDEEGNRIIGTTVHPRVIEDVYNQQKECFYDKVQVDNMDYFAYYAPLYNSDHTCIGMIFAGKPTDVVHKEILEAVCPILIIALIMMAFTSFICNSFTKEIVDTIAQEKSFLRGLSEGNLKAELDSRIMQRNDELGEMGRFTIHVQKFLREMVERDALTRLYSRRIGETKLKQLQQRVNEDGTSFCIAIGDIDFFKKFNDEYGHDCGDLVLKEIAFIFNREMMGKGFAIRWGGEEFLIIYENRTLEEALRELNQLKKCVTDHELKYKEQILHITMTFGITEGTQEPISSIIKEADEKLYTGKMNGRNCIISE